MTINFHFSGLKEVAAKLWQQYNQFNVWAFNAPMGAGKTTLIQALCQVLQVKDSVSSPTFSIINEYQSTIAGRIYHMDWYRLKDEAEAVNAGCEDYIESGNLCFVEWPGKAPHLLPEKKLQLHIEIINHLERRLKVIS